MNKREAPVFLNLLQIRMPMTAIVSILHRLSGLLLFMALPFFIYILQESLRNVQSFTSLVGLLDSFVVKILLALFIWSAAHHLFAGLRFLLLDIDVGIERQQARHIALLVNIMAVVVAASVIWGYL